MKQLFFQSSLPRAGSTLLQNILAQNPEFYATPTSGLVDLITSSRRAYTSSDAFRAQDPDEMKEAFLGFCKQGMEGYFNAITDKPYILDKSRGWINNYRFLNMLYPETKMVCMVRDPRDIFASMEKNLRKNPHKDVGLENPSKMQNLTTAQRIDTWVQGPPVGIAMERLFQVINDGTDKNILFIKYETFTRQPERLTKKIYEYFELPYYEHDFDNIQQLTHENDIIHGIFGDHQIKTGSLRPSKSTATEVLGKGPSDWIKNKYKWFYNYFRYD